ncbi:MAG: glycosyltransferase family 4 protein [Bacteroidia bacterium]|nr:glycosyltransferase family 4 protein [Bacteroidia bacterium]
MRPLKILHIIWSAEMGGIGKVVLNLCKAQKEDPEIEVAVLIAKPEGLLLKEFQVSGICLYEGQLKHGHDIKRSLLQKCRKIMQGFDILHFHSFNPLLAEAGRQSGCKMLYTEHGNFGIGRKAGVKDRLVRVIQGFYLNRIMDGITFNSQFSRSLSESRFGLKKVKKQVIYNGIPSFASPSYSGMMYRHKAEEFILASVGRLATVKRFDRIIEAISLLDPKLLRVIIMGEGPERTHLEALIKKYHLETFVQLPGVGDSRRLIHEADLCVLPSSGEAFGLVALEAFQQGKPVLVFNDGGGLKEIVEQVEPHLVVNSTADLAAKIREAIQSPDAFNHQDLRSKRIHYAAQFSIEKMAGQFKSLYTTL